MRQRREETHLNTSAQSGRTQDGFTPSARASATTCSGELGTVPVRQRFTVERSTPAFTAIWLSLRRERRNNSGMF